MQQQVDGKGQRGHSFCKLRGIRTADTADKQKGGGVFFKRAGRYISK